MLVLSRKVGEQIQIGENIRVTVVRIAPGVVRLGIEAPRDSSIARQELLVESRVGAAEPDQSIAPKPNHPR